MSPVLLDEQTDAIRQDLGEKQSYAGKLKEVREPRFSYARIALWIIVVYLLLTLLLPPAHQPQEDLPSSDPTTELQLFRAYDAGQVVSGTTVIWDAK